MLVRRLFHGLRRFHISSAGDKSQESGIRSQESATIRVIRG
jgi:hypothetical protein